MSTRNLFSSPVRSDSYDTIVPKKGSKSQIWGCFGLPADVDGNIIDPGVAVCNTCRREVGCKGGSTSNMRSHIRNHHSSLFKQILAAERGHKAATAAPIINSVNTPSTSSNNSSKRIKKEVEPIEKSNNDVGWSDNLSASDDTCTKALTRFFALENVPLGLINRPNFRSFVHCLNRSYQLPDQQYFSEKAIPELYHNTLFNVRRLLASHAEYVALTCDSWTSICGQSFIALTAHFLDPDFQLDSVCLKCTQFMRENLAGEIVELLRSILDQWGLRISHITACTTDDQKVVTEAIECLNLSHVPCFGYSLGSGLSRALKLPNVEKALACIRKLRCILVQNAELGRNLEDTGNMTGLQLCRMPADSPDSWRSTLDMCRYFLDHRIAITNSMPEYRNILPDETDLQSLEALTDVLKPLEELAGHISGDNYLIASSVVPVYYYTNQLLKIEANDSPVKVVIKEAMMETLEQCYGHDDLKNLLRFCTFCDPRYRLQFFNEDDRERVREEVHKGVVRLNTPKVESGEQPPTFDLSLLWTGNDYTASPQDVSVTASSTKQRKGIATLLERLVTDQGSKSLVLDNRTVQERVNEELDRYLQMPSVTLDSNPLLWWKSNAGLFPMFQKMAKKYLIVQGSSVPGECMFGSANQALNSLRSTLTPNLAEMQVFLAKNKKYMDLFFSK